MIDGLVKHYDLTPGRKGQKVNLLILNDYFLVFLVTLKWLLYLTLHPQGVSYENI